MGYVTSFSKPAFKSAMALSDGDRVGVVGGGPAGSFFSYFLLDMAKKVGLSIELDLYEPRDFWGVGPASCNMCGGIVSESLVQNLAAEGINLPPTIVQRAIDSYVLHTPEGTVRIDTPLNEMRIAAVYRAGGPRDVKEIEWGSFDGYLLTLAIDKGAFRIEEKVDDIEYGGFRPKIKTKNRCEEYDLVVFAAGVNSTALKMFDESNLTYKPPKTTKTFLREYFFTPEEMDENLGSSMHVFLLNLPSVEFAAIIPKGVHASTCMLGDDINKSVLKSFMDSERVVKCMPPGWDFSENACQCAPRMNVGAAEQPFGDKIVFIGDAGVTRLYKDGIGAAYRTAKAAAMTAVIQGVSTADFARYYQPTCEKIEKDNTIGRFMFSVTEVIQKLAVARRAVIRMVAAEQSRAGHERRMSMVLWDLFTGSAPYREILKRTIHPKFIAQLLWHLTVSLFVRSSHERPATGEEEKGARHEMGRARNRLRRR